MSKQSPFEIDSERHGTSARIRASGELDLATCGADEHLPFADTDETFVAETDGTPAAEMGVALAVETDGTPAAEMGVALAVETDGAIGLPRRRGEGDDDDAMLVEEGAP